SLFGGLWLFEHAAEIAHRPVVFFEIEMAEAATEKAFGHQVLAALAAGELRESFLRCFEQLFATVTLELPCAVVVEPVEVIESLCRDDLRFLPFWCLVERFQVAVRVHDCARLALESLAPVRIDRVERLVDSIEGGSQAFPSLVSSPRRFVGEIDIAERQ